MNRDLHLGKVPQMTDPLPKLTHSVTTCDEGAAAKKAPKPETQDLLLSDDADYKDVVLSKPKAKIRFGPSKSLQLDPPRRTIGGTKKSSLPQ